MENLSGHQLLGIQIRYICSVFPSGELRYHLSVRYISCQYTYTERERDWEGSTSKPEHNDQHPLSQQYVRNVFKAELEREAWRLFLLDSWKHRKFEANGGHEGWNKTIVPWVIDIRGLADYRCLCDESPYDSHISQLSKAEMEGQGQ